MEVTEPDVKGATGSSVPLGEEGSTESPTRQQSAATQHQMKLIKPLLSSASRLGKALAELFGLLVKVCSLYACYDRMQQNKTTIYVVCSEPMFS